MFLPIKPGVSYKKEDMPTIDYSSRSDKEYFKHQIIVLSLCSLALIGALVLAIVSNLFNVCWCALTICATPILVMWVILIKDYVKYKRKMNSNRLRNETRR